LITTTDELTNWLPVTFRMNVPLASDAVIDVGVMDVSTGTGRELPQSGLIAEQPGQAKTPSSGSASDHFAMREDISQLLGWELASYLLFSACLKYPG
jgi:hypothetical protein